MNQQTCSECGNTKSLAEFDSVPKILQGICYECWKGRTNSKWSQFGYDVSNVEPSKYNMANQIQGGRQSHSQAYSASPNLGVKMVLVAMLGIVILVGGLLVHRSNPCNTLPPADHKVLEYVESKYESVAFTEVSEATGLSLRTVSASAQRLEECGRLTSS